MVRGGGALHFQGSVPSMWGVEGRHTRRTLAAGRQVITAVQQDQGAWCGALCVEGAWRAPLRRGKARLCIPDVGSSLHPGVGTRDGLAGGPLHERVTCSAVKGAVYTATAGRAHLGNGVGEWGHGMADMQNGTLNATPRSGRWSDRAPRARGPDLWPVPAKPIPARIAERRPCSTQRHHQQAIRMCSMVRGSNNEHQHFA